MARPPWPRETHLAFWRYVAAGLSTENAGAAVGVSRPVAYRWFAASGGVMPVRAVREPARSWSRAVHGRRLTQAAREEIADWHRLRKTVSGIAEASALQKPTAARALPRTTAGGGDRAATPQPGVDKRTREARAKPAKLAVNSRLRVEVERRL